MLNRKNPGFWIGLLMVIAVVLTAVCLMTSQREAFAVPPPEAEMIMSATEERTAEMAIPAAGEQTVVTVKNADEFLAAIGPNTEIRMEPGSYILSESESYGKTISDYCIWEERFDGYELRICNVVDLTIRGSGAHVTTLETDPRYANVMSLAHCSNVVLEDFTAGHTRDRGECGGGVIDLSNCNAVTMNRMGLFGCGVVGVTADGCSGITLTDSDVYECSSSAVGVYNCSDVVIFGCRIRNIGDEQYGGYTFFDIQDCSGVFIENNQLSDSSLSSLLAVAQSKVLLKNNLFERNRPQSGAFSGSRVSITLDGNRFENNTIRNWYSNGEAAQDTDGNMLTEADLDRLYGTESETIAAPQMEVHVSTVDELIAAIGPDREIVLDAAVYDLSTATGYGTSENEYYCWEDIFDGPGLVIRNVSNMTIRSNDGKFTEHTIEAVPRYADVLQFRACSNITLSGFTAGHTKEPGSCTGGVLEFRDSDGVTVDNCGLFGCGMGVQAENCGNVIVQNSTIYECSQGGIEMRNVDGIVIEGTSFRDIGGRNIIQLLNCKNAMVDGNMTIGAQNGSFEASTVEQEKTYVLQATVNDFSNSYLYNDREFMQIYLAEGYEPEPWVTEYECTNLYWFEITYDHVRELEKAGKLVFEVPFLEWNGTDVNEEDRRWLLVTVIVENGSYKVSDCREK